MQVVTVARSYCAELTIEQFLAIEALDDIHISKGNITLAELMEAAGARQVEYNGHFGAAIYFTLPDDLQDQFANIILLINSYITVAKEKGYVECH